jgi:hypothetical protein
LLQLETGSALPVLTMSIRLLMPLLFKYAATPVERCFDNRWLYFFEVMRLVRPVTMMTPVLLQFVS